MSNFRDKDHYFMDQREKRSYKDNGKDDRNKRARSGQGTSGTADVDFVNEPALLIVPAAWEDSNFVKKVSFEKKQFYAKISFFSVFYPFLGNIGKG